MDTKEITQLEIEIKGDFPWAETQWEDVSKSVSAASLSATGKRALFEARGEIFTVPVEHGDTRNITQSSGTADRAPVWSPDGEKIAWFSDAGDKGYTLMIGNQNGISETKSISIGDSKLGWEPAWSPDGKYIAFVDDKTRIRLVNIEAGTIKTIDTGGNNMERGNMGLTWSPDSKRLAYAKAAANNFRQITVSSVEDGSISKVTDVFADAFSPAWDRDKIHFYFLASTDLALGSGWANTSAMTADAEYSVYIVNLQKDVDSPFKLQSDEEEVKKDNDEGKGDESKKKEKDKKGKDNKKNDTKEDSLKIDFNNISARTMALPVPKRKYSGLMSGPEGTVFVAESVPNQKGNTLQKFTLKDREAKEFVSGVSKISVSDDGKKMLGRFGSSWKVMDTSDSSGKDGKSLNPELKMKLDRSKE